MQVNWSREMLLGALCVGAIACGPENGKEANVIVAMDQIVSASLQSQPEIVVPNYFGVKVMGVSLRYVADPTNTNSAPEYESGIYLNPTGCTNGGKTETEKDGKKYEYYQPPGPDSCDATQMQYVDFAQDIDAVNAELGAGLYPVIPGVYNQATICFSAIYGVRVDDHMAATQDLNTAGETTTPFGCQNTILEGFEVGESEYATVELNYDLSVNSVQIERESVTGPSRSECYASETEDGTYVCTNGLLPQPEAFKW